jgi:hypothetical protein
MTNTLHFKGFIKGIKYQPHLTEGLSYFDLTDFDINKASSCGVIRHENADVAYSKWVSPKRTRSYPFARIYNTYNASKVITIIPVIKDEGKDGDRDRIQYSTISWMNLLNVYIVLAYYEKAEKSNKKGQVNKHKLTCQAFNSEFVNEQIKQILSYRQSALHWNKNLFEERFIEIFQTALDCYDKISLKTQVAIHSRRGMNKYLQDISREFEKFRDISLKNSEKASYREVNTNHKLEYLTEGVKATLTIENYLGGIYYLTVDEIFRDQDIYIIQESKNTTKDILPKLPDIQDGLFKLILYSNLDSLMFQEQSVSFSTKLKLTGNNIEGTLQLPVNSQQEIDKFLTDNQGIFKPVHREIIHRLILETKSNYNLGIEITGNS